MSQSASVRPDPSFHRKAAIAHGAALDHRGEVRIEPIPNFDLDRTIFQTLEGAGARYVMATRVGREVHWKPEVSSVIQAAYDDARRVHALPEVSEELMEFMADECDFDVEHADGSFLDHLYFCFEYTVQHYPEQPALVMLMHSILGTGTNTFAMTADKIPELRALMDPVVWTHTDAFPSVLRLLYSGTLRRELRSNVHRPDALRSIRFHRVIDNEPITLSGEELWIALNFQLVHLVDFLPAANWQTHQNETSFILFRDLHDLLGKAGKRQARVGYEPASGSRLPVGERHGLGSWLTTMIPVSASEKMAGKSVSRFSKRIGHSLDYEISWA
jgi:hypothetical protein